MPTITLQASYKKNSGLVISAEELLSRFLYGLNIRSTDGTVLSNKDIEDYILAAQGQIERNYSLLLNPVLVTEKLDYYRDDYENGFPVFKTSFPVRVTKTLMGELGTVSQIVYPPAWLQCRTSSKNRYYKQFSIVPNGSTVQADANVILSGVFQYGIRGFSHVSNYWTTQYESGYMYGTLPSELVNLVSLVAAIPVLAIYGDIVLSSPGIASMSLSIDGLSNSVSSKNAAFAERIKLYNEQIQSIDKRIRNTYKGIEFAAC